MFKAAIGPISLFCCYHHLSLVTNRLDLDFQGNLELTVTDENFACIRGGDEKHACKWWCGLETGTLPEGAFEELQVQD
jgi:hypothetical protein